MGDDSLTVRLENRLAEIPRAIGLLDTFCAGRGIPAAIAFNFELALDEILTNVISYAFTENERHEIEVRIHCGVGELIMELIDDGKPFDPLSVPPPDTTAPLEDREIGGLGIHMVKTVMDSVAYQRDGNRNHLELRRRIDTPGAS